MNELENKIESKVMDNIKSGKVKLRSKYIFLAERLGLGSAVVLSLLLSILFFNLALFYLKASDNLGYLSFGSRGFFAFLESFPYLLVISFIILILIAGSLFKKTEIAYQKPFGYLALGLVVFILLTGAGLAFTSIAEQIERQAFEARPFGYLFKPFLLRSTENHQSGIVGRIVEIGEDYVSIQTPQAVEKLKLKTFDGLNKDILLEGNFVVAIGEREDDNFEVINMRVIESSEMPMIRRAIHRRFGSDTIFSSRQKCGIPILPPVSTTVTCH